MANVDGIRQELVKADWSNLFAGKGSSGKWEMLSVRLIGTWIPRDIEALGRRVK